MSVAPINCISLQCLKDAFLGWQNINISLQYDLRNTSKLHVDVPKVLRVVANLLTNALEATKGDCTIFFESSDIHRDDSTYLRLVVGNTNSFIPEEKLHDIFEMFYTSGKSGGTGLGLAVAKKFTEQHGGGIFCRSDKIKGTEFVIDLPAITLSDEYIRTVLPAFSEDIFSHKKLKKIETSNLIEKISKNREIILIIDDDPFIRDAWISKLNTDICFGFASGRDLELWFKKNKECIAQVSFVIIDLYIDGNLEGFELADLCRRYLTSKVKIFLSSDSESIDDVTNSFDAILKKDPLSMSELRLIKSRASNAS